MLKFKMFAILLPMTLFFACKKTSRPQETYEPREYEPSTCKKNLLLDLTKEEQKKDLYKVLLINENVYLYSVPSFMIDFTRGLKARGWHIYDVSQMQGPMKKDLSSVTGIDRYPDIVVIYNAEKRIFDKWPEFFNVEMKNSILIHWADEVHQFRIKQGIKHSLSIADAIFPRYHHAALRVLLPEQPKCFQMPHAATEIFFKEIRHDKMEKVFLSGATDPGYYPLREKAYRLLRDGNHNIVAKKHPGYEYMQDPEKEAHNYAEEISKYLMAISGGGFGPYLPGAYLYAKHFEIPAAGTALITDVEMIPYLREYDFEPNYHYIPTRRDNLKETIDYWLSQENREELMLITKRGQDLVRKFHRNEQRINTFDQNATNLFHEKQRRN